MYDYRQLFFQFFKLIFLIDISKKGANQRRDSRQEEDNQMNCLESYPTVEASNEELDEFSYCPAFTPDELDGYVPFRKSMRLPENHKPQWM